MLSAIRDLVSRTAPQRLGRLTEGAQKCTAHLVSIAEAGVLRHDVDRMPALLHKRASCFHAQFFDCFCRRLPCFGAEGATELPRTEMGSLRQLGD